MAEQRLTVTLPSAAHAHLLKWWAKTSGRPLSNLASSLLEDGIKQALRDGTAPAGAVDAMNDFIGALAEHHAEEWQAEIAQAKEIG